MMEWFLLLPAYTHTLAVLILVSVFFLSTSGVDGVFEFSKLPVAPSKDTSDYLSKIPAEEWQQLLTFGIESVSRQRRLEDNLKMSLITVENGSISHLQLLDALPSDHVRKDIEVAQKILAATLLTYNRKCLERGINGADCHAFLMNKKLSTDSELRQECLNVIRNRQGRYHPFRRLLPKHYKDGIYEMVSENLPSPLTITETLLNTKNATMQRGALNERDLSLALVQWAQFIEHDLSKPVVTSMGDGTPIECCSRDGYRLNPRFQHPACAYLVKKTPPHKYGTDFCLNYVRSALAVESECTLGAVDQLNQATGNLDLSQLYGITESEQQRLRSFSQGQLKTSTVNGQKDHLLPITHAYDTHEFCAFQFNADNSICFMAGDSRVDSNPFSIVLYTIFLRNHNRIAKELSSQFPNWSDDRLFERAKAINTFIYRHIVFNEWLPQMLGEAISKKVTQRSVQQPPSLQVSNEFAVAAIRFYLSMIPNELHSFSSKRKGQLADRSNVKHNNILPEESIFRFKDQHFRPKLFKTPKVFNSILESLLHQRVQKMDSTYEDSFILGTRSDAKPDHPDILAFDIQRGRDHGLQDYVKYLEICADVKINSWSDLEQFISKKDVATLKDLYRNFSDIDLIIGGISEMPVNGSAVGPTFSCIIAEQFSRIYQWEHSQASVEDRLSDMSPYQIVTASDLLCANSDLSHVPTNIFQLSTQRNPLITCDSRR